jgi:hypothetical protein
MKYNAHIIGDKDAQQTFTNHSDHAKPGGLGGDNQFAGRRWHIARPYRTRSRHTYGNAHGYTHQSDDNDTPSDCNPCAKSDRRAEIG